MRVHAIRKAGKLAAIAAAALFACAALAAPHEDPVNIAGRQRMLSQRIVRVYCQVGLGVLADASRVQLREAIALFERQQAALRSATADNETQEALLALDRAWRPFKALAMKPANLERARQLNARDAQVLDAAQRVTRLFESAAPKGFALLINLAGRQRMLSQRLAKIYMLQAWGVHNPDLRRDAVTARAEFGAALAKLGNAPQNSDEVRRELAAVEIQWKWFENALALEGTHAYKLVVADASESIANSMDRVVQLYERLDNRDAP